MSDEKSKYNDIDAIINGAFKEISLRELFEKRLHELAIPQTTAQGLLNIERRSLNGILDGTQKRVDFTNFHKLAIFLKIPTEELIQKHIELMEKNFMDEDSPANKKKFIRENFDLAALKKSGFIDSVLDFQAIEHKINSFFGFNSIFEYRKRSFASAFSSGSIKPKNSQTRDFWLTAAKNLALKLDNPYNYSREELVKFFPQIRKNSTNVKFGLLTVIKGLFKIGITVIFQSSFSSLHLRGATFSVNGKPCIVLTDYKGFYPTLWHALIHELYHVLFDWEKLKNDSYHLSEDAAEVLTIDENEIEADHFAREYLFSKTKMDLIKPKIWSRPHVEEFARIHEVDSSVIYIYNAFDTGNTDRMVWARTRKLMPEIKDAISRVENPWEKSKPIEEIAKKMKLEIYN